MRIYSVALCQIFQNNNRISQRPRHCRDNAAGEFILGGVEMVTRQHLANIAKIEAQRCFHGAVMQTEPNIHPIIEPFPKWNLNEADGMWCAAFVYYCCIKAGFIIPIRPKECKSCNLAGCGAWEEWAMADENIIYSHASKEEFLPEVGDIVLFDKVFIDAEHDHIGIVIENKSKSIVVAEGNINNVSGIIERNKDAHIRAYIRLPDNYVKQY